MKKALVILLAMLSFPVCSFSQTRTEVLMGADNLKRMLQLGLCTQTAYTVHKGVKTPQTVFKYDTSGFLLMWASAFAGSFNTCTYEKDSRGYIARTYYHEVEDTSKVTLWNEYENDSLGNHIKTTSHTPDGKAHVDEVITSRHDGKYDWHFSTRYNGFDTIKSATRSCYESKSLWMVDYIYYDKNDSIKEIKTYFSDYDSLGRLVAWRNGIYTLHRRILRITSHSSGKLRPLQAAIYFPDAARQEVGRRKITSLLQFVSLRFAGSYC
jgi:hypothetical protein